MQVSLVTVSLQAVNNSVLMAQESKMDQQIVIDHVPSPVNASNSERKTRAMALL